MIVGILQARMSSTRLPGKVLAPILGEPMIGRQLARIARCRSLDRIVLATSVEPDDDVLADFAARGGVEVHRGPKHDVLRRYAGAAARFDPRHVVRLTGDCPLCDWDTIDAAVELHLQTGAAYTSNVVRRTYPDGYDVEVVAYGALVEADAEATDPGDREHVTPFVRRHRDRYAQAHLVRATDDGDLRLTVDTSEDLMRVRAIYEALLPANPDFRLADVLALLDRVPSLAYWNPA